MASETPTNNIIFTEDEDLLDDDDADVVGDSDNDDSASSAAAAAAAQVTIAVPGVSDLHLPPQHNQVQEIIVAKKPPAQLDESRKLFQRLWTDEDEIELLQGFLDYNTHRAGNGTHNPHHHHDTSAFYDQIRSKFQLDFNKNQLVEKLRRLKKKYRNVVSKFGTGKEYVFKSPHDQATFEISARIWGNTAPVVVPPPPPTIMNVNGSAFRPTPIDEDEVDPNNHDYQSPYPNDIDMNTKFPRPRKRNRVGSVKMEDKQAHVHAVNNSNLMSNQQAEAVTPISTAGIAGSISGVIEETVKSCLSPIFKELLGNSTSSNANGNGSCYGQGSSMLLSPMPLGFAGAMSAEKTADNRWRKQQILELEVFSKRLELMQDEINEKLQELRSMGNN